MAAVTAATTAVVAAAAEEAGPVGGAYTVRNRNLFLSKYRIMGLMQIHIWIIFK
jgi:hypothetical protein